MASSTMPVGLYRPEFEHDACGVAFVVDMHGRRSHEIVRNGPRQPVPPRAPRCLGSGGQHRRRRRHPDPDPRSLLPGRGRLRRCPSAGAYATGIAFLPTDADEAGHGPATASSKLAADEDLAVLGWREVPIDASPLGSIARSAMPSFHQVFVAGAAATAGVDGLDLERRAFILRKRVEHELAGLYFASLSARTVVYKGMLTAPQVEVFFPDLGDERVDSALALVHSRFSTNTFPSWPLAHPYRYLAHNGEINTLQGNRNWMRAREALLASDLLPGDLERIFPIVTPGASDSASFDEVLELLHLGGRSLPHAVLMMIPEAWENHRTMDPARRAFYQFHAAIMEPWDGPASIAFTDGTRDRRGPRPQRAAPLALLGHRRRAGRHGLGGGGPRHRPRAGSCSGAGCNRAGCSWSTPPQGRIVADEEIKSALAAEHPYARLAGRQADPLRRPRAPLHTHPAARVDRCPPAAVRLHHRGPQDPARPDGPRPASSRSARWAPTRRSPCCPTGPACCTTTSSSCSPRSPTRPWTPSARSW